jgi:hypothetical protein
MVEKLMAALLLPGLFSPPRLGFCSAVRTGVLPTHWKFSYPFSSLTAQGTNDALAPGDAVIALLNRNPWARLLMNLPSDWKVAIDTITAAGRAGAAFVVPAIGQTSPCPVNVGSVTHSNPDAVGNTLEPVFYDPSEMNVPPSIWFSGAQSGNVTWVLNGSGFTPTAADYVLGFRRRISQTELTQTMTCTTATATALTFTVTFPTAGSQVGFYELYLIAAVSGGVVTSVTVTTATAASQVRITPAYNLGATTTYLPDSQRLNAGRLLFTNTAAPVNREGMFATMQLADGGTALDYIYPAGAAAQGALYQAVSATNNVHTDQVVRGASVPLRLTSVADLQFVDVSATGGALSQSAPLSIEPVPFDALESGVVLCIHTQTTTTTQRDALMTVEMGDEVQSDSQIFPQDYPEYPPSVVEEAVFRMRFMPYGSENPEHISQALQAVAQTAPHAINQVNRGGILQTLLPAGGAILGGLLGGPAGAAGGAKIADLLTGAVSAYGLI